MKKFLALSLCLSMLFATSCGSSDDGASSSSDIANTYSRMSIEKQAGKDFKILQLTDIQIIDPNQQPYPGRISAASAILWADRDATAFNQVRELVASENPDYIVLTGDNVYGQFDADGSNFIALVELMDSFGIPWSFVNGNHDGETIVTNFGQIYECGKGMAWQADYAINNTEHCLYETGDVSMGYGNYVVNLTENGEILYSFVMMDSHGCDAPNGITPEQIAWYENEINTATEVTYGKENASSLVPKVVPSLMFFHIPTAEFTKAIVEILDRPIGKISDDGLPLPNGDFGWNKETPSTMNSTHLWASIKNLKSTKGIFVGHNHTNNASINYQGVRLTFGTKTGSYDSSYQQGGTRITIKDGSLKMIVEPVYASNSPYGKMC